MSWDNNPYYNPENLGLEIIGQISWSEECYDFDYTCVWKGENGYYIASDSGCSCPSPFEDYNSVESLGETYDLAGVHSVINAMVKEHDGGYGYSLAELKKQAAEIFNRL